MRVFGISLFKLKTTDFKRVLILMSGYLQQFINNPLAKIRMLILWWSQSTLQTLGTDGS